ncbi:5'-3' exonuclease [Dokdonella fugitiva]|jgi:5'-3' exonuclease|uniref:5'-3' exonuclease n=1 Tax=Dokdonella fugitiva TaxID=328517 RepID=A0A4R2ID70_9GAMM|nr:5'-3' exonuclease H3TH domain-containing protein [Dokdonella fugitiva]MBA8885684.1 5'-3' exonuclease [Dokdonella fugitiva]TCO41719.1 5'-3' exonuclease [Dokdonella fugitiva]
MGDTVHLVDGSLYVCRAWFAQVPDAHDADGHPVHAVHGFARFLLDLFERAKPTHVAVAFDESLNTSFRNALYPAYKANRPAAPADLMRQFEGCKAIARALGAAVLSDDQYEADDLIGSALARLREAGFRGVIVSADKDFGQLIGHADEQWDPARNQRWDSAGVKSRLGVHPHQVADYLALTGDAVDNIPGVPGIGAKTAAILLHHFGTLDALLSRAEEVAFLRARGAAAAAMRLREHAELARLSRALTGIALDAPVPASADDYRRKPLDAAIDDLLERMRFGPLTRARVRALREG